MEIDDIVKQLKNLATQTARLTLELEEQLNHNEKVTEEVAAVKAAVTQLEVVVLGKPEYRVIGTAERVDNLESLVSEIVKSRRSERDKLRGLQIGLGLTIFTSGGTLITLLTQVFG